MTHNARFARLLEPGYIGRVKTRNRIVKTGAGLNYRNTEGYLKNELAKPFFDALARGGVGLIITETLCVDYPLGALHDNQLRVDDDKYIPSLTEFVQTIHKHGCPVFTQLLHAGARHSIRFTDGLQPVAASPLTASEMRVKQADIILPRELTVPEIKELVDKFARAAERSQKAGFDGVELFATNSSHLLNSFLSRAWNKRTDAYGCDSLANRARFVVEIIQGIKQRLGKDFPVGVIMNGAEYGLENGLTPEESQGIAQILEMGGADYLQVRSYGYGDYYDLHVPDTIFFPEPPQSLAKPLDGSRNGAGIVVPLAAAIKQRVSIPVITVGRLDPELGEKILEDGRADFIGLNRRLIADQELPNKVASGRLADITPCTACLHCLDDSHHARPVHCRINAAVGGDRDYVIKPAPRRKTVVVVGGGPAGMEAARVAALRGHEVVLFEKESRLGGLLPMAALVKGLEIEDLGKVVRYLKSQITRLGVQIRTGKEVSVPAIEELKPDVVIVATGGLPVLPQIPGIDRNIVFSSLDLHRQLKTFLRFFGPGLLRRLTGLWMPVGKNVVIMGGGLQGYELVEFMVKRGRRVTILDTGEALADVRMDETRKVRLLNWMARKGVTVITGIKFEEITDKGVVIITREGQRQTIAADSVIPAMPLVENTGLIRALEGKVPEVYAIGDCKQPRLIIDAIADGYNIARVI